MSKNPWGLPASWSWEQIGEVCEVVGGATPPTGEASNFDGGDIAWVTPADLSGYREKLIGRGERNITKAGLESSAAKLLPKGTVLFSSRAPIGYVAIAANPLATNQGFKSFVSPSGILPDYLYYYLQRAKPLALELASGTTFLEVSAKRAAQIPLAIAPTNEQHRIVEKLEELFPDLEAGVAALERARANLKRYRAAVLKAAVEGRLTEQWRKEHPDVEPASKLLERILVERRKKWGEGQLAKFASVGKAPPKGWKETYEEPPVLDQSESPTLPNGWCWATVEQTSDVQGGIQKQPKRSPKSNAFPYLRVANVRRNRLDLRELEYFELFGNELKTFRLETGDLLVVEGNGSKTEIGRSAIWRGEVDNCVHQNHIIRVRFMAGIPEYLNAYWNSPGGNTRVMERAASTSGLYTLSVQKVSELVVPIPCVEEQRQIVIEVESRLTAIDHAEDELGKALARASRLRQSVLKRAFEGKLVPQDPSDEPASILLERIRQVRAAEGAHCVPKRRKSPA